MELPFSDPPFLFVMASASASSTSSPSSTAPTATDPKAVGTPEPLRKRRVVVIGAGIAGLTAAGVLQFQGCDVTVVEAVGAPHSAQPSPPSPSLRRTDAADAMPTSSLLFSTTKALHVVGGQGVEVGWVTA